ncbi:glycosyltransferase [Robertmurraya kyonggiensis]|uniref:Glycosyltransferase n=1 Tax=Robertmurraya kyonggiensis TaxID=1037680 RepID=A0A4U1D2V2_9BACI|nr:glycosyltransferase [Robertmurraya kyonggiensis]TKC15497.1 glycosyltransferase [Robertmurraya kyonggiensis]
MNDVKVSVIIPVYNNEKFLNKCLDSVLNQTLSDCEIITVNDGSIDGSLDILRNYENSHSDIVVIDQENGGYSNAVNRALSVATGNYIAFVDADDYIEPKMLETLYYEATFHDLDVVLCNWDRVDVKGNFINHHDHVDFDNKIFTSSEIIREFFLNKKELVEAYSWNKLMKRSLFQDFQIEYPDISYGDIPTIFKILTKIKKCKYINQTFYHYVQHHTSFSFSKNEKNVTSFIEAIHRVKDVLEEENLFGKYRKEYFIYTSGCFLTEFGACSEVLKESDKLRETFEKNLKPITIQEFIKYNRPIDYELLLKLFLYKAGLLRLCMVSYHKIKPIFEGKRVDKYA